MVKAEEEEQKAEIQKYFSSRGICIMFDNIPLAKVSHVDKTRERAVK